MKRPLVYLFINVDWFALSHFYSYISYLSQHAQVFLFTEVTCENQSLSKVARIVPLPSGRKKGSIFDNITSLLTVLYFFLFHKPDAVEFFSLKPIVFWGFIARLLNIKNRFHYFTGLGSFFQSKTWLLSFVKFTVTYILSGKHSFLIAENRSNLNLLLSMVGNVEERTLLLPGVGVDVDFFKPRKSFTSSHVHNKPFSIGMASRLLRDKGIFEYVKACSHVNKLYPGKYEFLLAGSIDLFNPTSLSSTELDNLLTSNPCINYIGPQSDLRSFFLSIDIFVLPSYHEGFPKVLVEASSCGLPIITTNVPGCRDVLDIAQNGLLVQSRNWIDLSSKLIDLSESPDLLLQFSRNARLRAVESFNSSLISNSHLNFILSQIQVS